MTLGDLLLYAEGLNRLRFCYDTLVQEEEAMCGRGYTAAVCTLREKLVHVLSARGGELVDCLERLRQLDR